MNSRELAHVALRLIGLYAFSVSLASTLQFLLAMERSSKFAAIGDSAATANFIASAVVCLTYEAFFLMLIFKSRKIATILFPEDTQVRLDISSESFQAVAYSSVGLFLLADCLPTIFQLLGNLWVAPELIATEEQRLTFQASQWAIRLGLIARLAIGFYLFLRPNSVAKLWKLLRELQPMERKVD